MIAFSCLENLHLKQHQSMQIRLILWRQLQTLDDMPLRDWLAIQDGARGQSYYVGWFASVLEH